jgi:hypothetical protein
MAKDYLSFALTQKQGRQLPANGGKYQRKKKLHQYFLHSPLKTTKFFLIPLYFRKLISGSGNQTIDLPDSNEG